MIPCTFSSEFRFSLLSPEISAKKWPVRQKAKAVPMGIETVISEVARARSLSENHLFDTMIYEFRMKGAAHAYKIVPMSTGQNQPLGIEIILNIAPKY